MTRFFEHAFQRCVFASLFVWLSAVRGQESVAQNIAEIPRGGKVTVIIPADGLPDSMRMAADDLVRYLRDSLQAQVKILANLTRVVDIEADLCIVTGSAADMRVSETLKQVGVAIPIDELGDEGGLVKSTSVGSKPVVLLVGATWTGACHAVYSFLEQELGIGFFIDGDRVPQQQKLALAAIDRREIPRVPIRSLFYHPTWPHPHANCCRLWSFDKWKLYIDWMRHRRLNVLPLFHDDGGYGWGDVVFNAFPKLEKNDKTLVHFVTDPTWRTETNRRIFEYARKSGIKIAFNLFYTQLPQFFPDYYPELEYHPLRMRNVGIKYSDPQCKNFMRKYWGAILETYGIDDSHLYILCSYKHELPLPEYLDSRNKPTLDAIEVLRELDPQAKIFMETWCWKYLNESPQSKPRFQWLNENAPIEWRRFDAAIPKDIGVADWDTKKDLERIPDPRFGERPYIQLTHTTMEGWWPPDTTLRHPQWTIDYFDAAVRDGADGIMSFHINPNTNSLLADLTAEVGIHQPRLPAYYRDFARRRFGGPSEAAMAQSLQDYCDAVDMGPNGHISSKRGRFEDMALFLTFPGFRASAEEMLDRSRILEDKRGEWIAACLERLKPKSVLAASALRQAKSASAQLSDDPFYKQYMWQLEYLEARMNGIKSLFTCYQIAQTSPAQAREEFDRAMKAFDTVKNLFRDLPGYHMNQLQTLEPDVPFNKNYLKNWEFQGALDSNTYAFHIVYERMSMFEEFMKSLLPSELGGAKRSSLDVRPFFEILKATPQ